MTQVKKEARMEEAVFTDEMLQEMRSKTGLKLRTAHSQNNAEATYYPLIKFADGTTWRKKLSKD